MCDTTMDRCLSPQTSMTLKVSRDDAQRMVEASRALNDRIAQLQHEREESSVETSKAPHHAQSEHTQDDSVPQRVVSTSDHGSVATEDTSKADQLILEAASSTRNGLVQSFLKSLRKEGIPEYEIRVCLLLFLDVGKSTKLMKAFNTLSTSSANEEGTTSIALSKADSDISESAALKSEGAVSLFRCLLTAISLCIQQSLPAEGKTESSVEGSSEEQPRKARKESEHDSPNSSSTLSKEVTDDADQEVPRASPSFDSGMDTNRCSVLTEGTRKEIDEIASFASEQLFDHVRKQLHDPTASGVTFDEFGGWYNAGGCSIVPWLELLDLSKWEAVGASSSGVALRQAEVPGTNAVNEEVHRMNGPSPVNFFVSGKNDTGNAESAGRAIVSFDFTGAMSSADGTMKRQSPFCINITEENLLMLKTLVHRTAIASRLPHEVCDILIRHSTHRTLGDKSFLVLHRNKFAHCIRDLVPAEAYRNFSTNEMEHFSTYFTDFFSCFEDGPDGLGTDQANVKELAVGFSFLCAGNKSSKLSVGFDLLDQERSGHLTQQQLAQYIRSYLTMLVGISLLATNPGEKKAISAEKRKAMIAAVDNGACWTLNHIVKHFAGTSEPINDAITFEKFADWYTVGGFKVAPWLELLDLSKLLALLGDSGPAAPAAGNYSVPPSSNRLRQTNPSTTKTSQADVLFTFPLANRRSLVVLREDAVYVRSVVEKLGLLPISPEDLWSSLYKSARSQPDLSPVQWNRSRNRKSGTGKSMDVDQTTFVLCMEGIMLSSSSGRKRSVPTTEHISPEAKETLMNFFQSFDLDQSNRVGLNQLMGGLSLLCGGKKSTKLAFAFGLFDGRNDGKKSKSKGTTHSLNGEELFLFLRSFLIVMFSCCRQSMDLSAEAVGRYISDSAHMVAEDVMRYQWQTRKRDRVDFDEFGEWYNEGGFETAPWLELLDLAKWVMVDDLDSVKHRKASPANGLSRPIKLEPQAAQGYDYPPPPPEDSLDTSFFVGEGNPLMSMGSMDEMDMMLMQQPSQDKENEGFAGNAMMGPLLASPRRLTQHETNSRPTNSLKFHLVTYDEQGGYMLSVSQRRVSHLRYLLMESGLYQINAEEASKIIVSLATPSSKQGSGNNGALMLTKDEFDSAMRRVISLGSGKANMTVETQRALSDLLAWIFNVFDRSRSGSANAVEVSCGLMVLCNGKKSDKLEYGFEVLDKNRKGKLSRREMANYLKSFLTTLLSVASAPCLDSDPVEDSIVFMNGVACDQNPSALVRAADRSSDWATGQAFKSAFKGGNESDEMSFDTFAEWYTSMGYTSIPWLELLDLRKWVLASSHGQSSY